MKDHSSSGVIALEACLSLTIFIFLVLFLYSFLPMFEAQYTLEHAMLEAGKSLSVETYAAEKIGGSADNAFRDSGSIMSILTAFKLSKADDGTDFVLYSHWYEKDADTIAAVKKRVIAYMGGEDTADSLLKILRVEDGVNGLDFTGTKVSGDDLIIHINYDYKMIFDYTPFGLSKVTIKLSCRNALWKN